MSEQLLTEKGQGRGSAMMDLYFVYKFAKFIAMPWE